MKNFIYDIPTKIYFGEGQIKNLGGAVMSYGKKALLVYGGGSIKRNGLYDAAVASLDEAGITVTELSGVEPNPRITTVREGAELCRKHGIEVVVPIGGGSTIDCAKVTAAAALYDGDPWDLVLDGRRIRAALPIVTVLTMAATGSEMDSFAVISDWEAKNKFGTGSRHLLPKASILDPKNTFSVPPRQTAAGAADIMSHTIETYFNRTDGAFLQNSIAEAILKTCIKYAPVAVAHPDDYEARANLMWASSLAINGLIALGAPMAWSVHPIEHELSAFYDVTHGIGLAILTPRWMQHILREDTLPKFVTYGVNVWGIDAALPPMEIAKAAIAKTYDFFASLGIPMNLSALGIGTDKLDVMADKAARMGLRKAFVPLTAEDAVEIYKKSM